MKLSITLNVVLSLLLVGAVQDLLMAGSGWEQCLSKPQPDISQQCVTWWFGGTGHEAARRRMCGVRK